MKKCTRCGKLLPLNMFYKDKTKKYGVVSQCKKCREEYKKKYRNENKEKIKEYRKKKYRKGERKEEMKEYGKKYRQSKHGKEVRKKYLEQNPGKYRYEDPEYIEWSWQVKNKSNFTCQVCDKLGGALNSHHLNGWKNFPNERYNIENGVCLCKECHKRYHDEYGYGNNTDLQFLNWLISMKVNPEVINQI